MATEMLHAGIPLPVVARRLDHQRPSTTLNFYAQAVPGGDAHAAETLEVLLAVKPDRGAGSRTSAGRDNGPSHRRPRTGQSVTDGDGRVHDTR
jgi:hypothetical protein